MFIRVTKKHTRERAGCKFIWRGGIGIRKTETTKNTKFRIIGVRKKKREKGGGVGIGFGWPNV